MIDRLLKALLLWLLSVPNPQNNREYADPATDTPSPLPSDLGRDE